MKTLNEEDKPALDDKAISQIVVDTLVSATKKSDTKNRLEDALKTTPVSPKKIADALAPSKITGSQSTTTSKSTKGTTGSKPTGSKSISDNNDSNQLNSNVSETIYNKGKNMNSTKLKLMIHEEVKKSYGHLSIKEQRLLEEGIFDSVKNAITGTVSSAATKVKGKLAKIPGLESLLASVKGKTSIGDLLVTIATALGGPKEDAAKALRNAAVLADKEKAEEAKNAPPSGTAPGAAPGAAPPGAPLKEFVSYLFEGTER